MALRILVPVDGSETTLQAARYAGQRLAHVPDATVTLLRVVHMPPDLLEHGGASLPEQEERIERDMEKARRDWLQERLRESQEEVFAPAWDALREGAGASPAPRVETRVAGDRPEGHAVTAVLDEIRDGGYDAVVLGPGEARGGDDPLGDLADEVPAKHPSCAVWIAD